MHGEVVIRCSTVDQLIHDAAAKASMPLSAPSGMIRCALFAAAARGGAPRRRALAKAEVEVPVKPIPACREAWPRGATDDRPAASTTSPASRPERTAGPFNAGTPSGKPGRMEPSRSPMAAILPPFPRSVGKRMTAHPMARKPSSTTRSGPFKAEPSQQGVPCPDARCRSSGICADTHQHRTGHRSAAGHQQCFPDRPPPGARGLGS